jgi:surface carbohydrate biosynthesis protein
VNIYIKMEILVRELEGRTLLGLIAAERGHRAVVGRMTDFFTPATFTLPPGIYHDKALTPTSRKLAQFERIHRAGSLITSQDEEHGLAHASYAGFAQRRFGSDTLGRAHRVFTWGQHDLDGIAEHHPDHRELLVATGSPRVDLWARKFDAYFAGQAPPEVPRDRPFVLVSSNFHAGGSIPFCDRNRSSRDPSEASYSPDAERFWYLKEAEDFRILADLIPALRSVASQLPDVDVIIRPHPKEDVRAWRQLVPPSSGVHVVQSGSIGPWIRAAAAVVYNGCTSGFESAVVGTPPIVFEPPGVSRGQVVNDLARRASTTDQLITLVREAVTHRTEARTIDKWMPPGGPEILRRRFADAGRATAAERIVDEWEALAARSHLQDAQSDTRIDGSQRRATRRVRLQSLARTARQVGVATRSNSNVKFAPLGHDDVTTVVDGLRTGLDRFHGVEMSMIGRHAFELRGPRGRST